MMSPQIRAFAIALLMTCTLIACGSDILGSGVDGSQSLPLIPNAGRIPYPIKFNGTAPIRDIDGNYVPAWDGTLVDLIAADAWAQCAAKTSSGIDAEPGDFYLSYLNSRISFAACGALLAEPVNFQIGACPNGKTCRAKQWARQRQTASCNVDTSTNQRRALSFGNNNLMGHPLPGLSAFQTPASTDARKEGAINSAQRIVDSAEINLCMAQKMRESLATGDSLLLRGAEQRELLQTIRERAQVSMVQYGLIGRALTNPDNRAGTIDSVYQVFPILKEWGGLAAASPHMARMGEEFAAAVQLHVQVSTELADLLHRSASARTPRGGLAESGPEEDWGAGSWRQRLLGLMYGILPLARASGEISLDDLLRDPDGLATAAAKIQQGAPWEARYFDGVLFWPNALPFHIPEQPYIRQLAPEPQVRVLLGLARSADGLFLKEVAQNLEFIPVRTVDVEASYAEIYRQIEAWLRTKQCVSESGAPSCVVAPNSSEIPPISQYESSLLWTRYGINPSHIRTLASLLADAMPRLRVPWWLAFEDYGPDKLQEREGALRLTGNHATLTGAQLVARIPGANPGERWHHIDPKFNVVVPGLPEQAPLYSLADVWIPERFDKWNVGSSQGFQADQIQRLGAMNALGATLDLITSSMRDRAGDDVQGFFAQGHRTIELITAAIGTEQVVVRPKPAPWRIYTYSGLGLGGPGSCAEFGDSRTNCWKVYQSGLSDGSQLDWEVRVFTASDNSILQENHTLIAVPGGGVEASAALSSDYTSFAGSSRGDLLEARAIAAGPPVIDVLAGDLIRATYNIRLPSGGTDVKGRAQQLEWSLFLKTGVGEGAKYRLLARNALLMLDQPIHAYLNSTGSNKAWLSAPKITHFFPYGGTLGNVVARAWARADLDWATPAFDAFGFNTDWVPPTDPNLSGAPERDSLSVYLGNARAAADEATNAVQTAMTALLNEEADEALLASAQQRAAEIGRIEQKRLCGGERTECDTSSKRLRLDSYLPGLVCVTDSDTETDCDPSDGEPEEICCPQDGDSENDCCRRAPVTLCSNLKKLLAVTLPSTVRVASAVYDHREAAAAPEFSLYRGGTLHSVMLEQWRALRAARAAAASAIANVEAKDSELAHANVQLQLACDSATWECSDQRFEDAMWAGYSFSDVRSLDWEGSADGWWFSATHVKGGKSWSGAALDAQHRACRAAQEALPAESKRHAATVAAAWAWLSVQAESLMQAGAALQNASAALAEALQTAEVAKAHANLDASLVGASAVTKFDTYRRYHSYDLWRARALLEGARRYAITARRAVEARYAVNLSTLTADEAFVAAPATWADEVYEYDLDAPAAVGLSRTESQQTGIYPNRLSDYIGNLERFVQGYGASRPTVVARQDVELIALPGPEMRSSDPQAADPFPGTASAPIGWEVRCHIDSPWFSTWEIQDSGATLAAACGGSPPVRARVSFSLDPWGRLQGSTVFDAVRNRHNARWTRLAVNVVGTGVKDCAQAPDVLGCYSEDFIRYSLRHQGSPWVSDFTEQWRSLNFAPGLIEGGKALAAEIWLEPISNGWGRPYVEAVARQEFRSRPLGGTYQLELELGAGVQLNRIERIQILAEIDYWVRQN